MGHGLLRGVHMVLGRLSSITILVEVNPGSFVWGSIPVYMPRECEFVPIAGPVPGRHVHCHTSLLCRRSKNSSRERQT